MRLALPHSGARPAASRRRPRLAALAPLALLVCGGCFATRNDVRVLQQDIQTLRAERAFGDSARAAQMDRIISQMRTSSDSIRSLASQFGRFQGDAREALRGLNEAVSTIQELTGQSQKRLQELRASLETRTEPAPGLAGTPGAPGDTTAAGGPGPNQLYQLALEQYQRGSYATARTGFEDLVKRFPTADVAADALYYIAEAYQAEKNTVGADSTYGAVVTRYPSAPRAATALYKRARLRQQAGRTADAKTLFQELRRRYPRSDEAELACGAMPSVCPKR